MLKSDKTDIRPISMRRILEIRSWKRENQIINGINNIPEINIDACLWYELINIFDRDIDEPRITQDITDEEIIGKKSSGKKLEITDLPSHSQSVERSVLLVFEACHCVFAKEARQKHIMAKILSKNHRKSFVSKSYYNET